MDDPSLVARPAESNLRANMETSSHTPLLAAVTGGGSTPTSDDTLAVEVQHSACSESGHPQLQSTTVGSIHNPRVPSLSEYGGRVSPSSEQGDPAGAPLATISFNEGSVESVDPGGRPPAEPVTRCMCCACVEGGHNDRDPCAHAAAVAQSDGNWNRSGRGQHGAAADPDATAGISTDRTHPRPEASQSLPSILLVPGRATRHSQQSPPASDAGCPPGSPHRPAGQSSSVRHPRVTGVASDSMLSLPTGDICRICHTGRRHEPLLGPCLCSGSMRYTHQRCLTTWLAQSGRSRCELCGYKFKTKMVGSRNIFQWKVLQVSVIDKLHLAVFVLALFLFAGTIGYITWTIFRPEVMLSIDTNSLAAQILLPVYCSLSLAALGLLVYETKSTCVRLARRWRAQNLGLRVLEREPDDRGDDAAGVVMDSPRLDGLERLEGGGADDAGGTAGRLVGGAASQSQAERASVDGIPSDWSVWSEPQTGCAEMQN